MSCVWMCRDPAEFWSSAAGGRPKRPLQDVGNRGASGVIVPRKQRKASSGATGKGGREVAHFIAKQAKKWAQIDDDVDLFEMCVPVSCLLSAPETDVWRFAGTCRVCAVAEELELGGAGGLNNARLFCAHLH